MPSTGGDIGPLKSCHQSAQLPQKMPNPMLTFTLVSTVLLLSFQMLYSRLRHAKLRFRHDQLEQRIAHFINQPAQKVDPQVSQYLQQWQQALAESQTQQHTDLKAALTDFTDGLASVRSIINLLSQFRNDLSIKQSGLVEREVALDDREKALAQAEIRNAVSGTQFKPGANKATKSKF